MRKFYLILSLCCLVGTGFAQIVPVYYEDFTNGIPADYKQYNLDGKTLYNANLASLFGNKGWIAYQGAAMSCSWYNPPAAADDWLVTKGIAVPTLVNPTNKFYLIWTANSSSAQYPDGYQVKLSETDQNTASFTKDLFSVYPEGADPTYRAVDVTDYAGKTVYFAFRNNTYDGELLFIDDILLAEVSPVDVAGEEVVSAAYIQQGSKSLKCKFTNLGHETVSSFTVNYSVNGGPVVSEDFDGLDLPFLETLEVPYGTQWNAMEGIHDIQMWMSNMNGKNDGNIDNDTAFLQVSVYDNAKTVERVPLVETFSSSTCAPCAPGNANLKTVVGTLTYTPVLLKYQQDFPGTGDPYATDETINRRNYYEINAIPDTRVDGNWWGGNTNQITKTIIDNAKTRGGLATIDAKYKLVPNEKKVIFTGTITALAHVLDGTRLLIAIKEKKTTKNKKTNGETEFVHVVKKMIPNEVGTYVPSMAPGESVSFIEEYTFPGNYRLPTDGTAANRIKLNSENSVEEFNDLEVSMWLEHYYQDSYVLNATDAETFSGPSLHVEEDSLYVEVDDVDPKVVDNGEIILDNEVTNVDLASNDYTWVRTLNDLPKSWTSAICDKNLCYLPTTDTEKFSLDRDSTGRMQLHVYPCGIPGPCAGATTGVGTVRISIANDNVMSDVTNLVYVVKINSSTGLDELDPTAISVYPNPTAGVVVVKDEQNLVGKILVYDAKGQLVSELARRNTQTQIDLTPFANGSYNIQVISQDQRKMRSVTVLKQ